MPRNSEIAKLRAKYQELRQDIDEARGAPDNLREARQNMQNFMRTIATQHPNIDFYRDIMGQTAAPTSSPAPSVSSATGDGKRKGKGITQSRVAPVEEEEEAVTEADLERLMDFFVDRLGIRDMLTVAQRYAVGTRLVENYIRRLEANPGNEDDVFEQYVAYLDRMAEQRPRADTPESEEIGIAYQDPSDPGTLYLVEPRNRGGKRKGGNKASKLQQALMERNLVAKDLGKIQKEMNYARRMGQKTDLGVLQRMERNVKKVLDKKDREGNVILETGKGGNKASKLQQAMVQRQLVAKDMKKLNEFIDEARRMGQKDDLRSLLKMRRDAKKEIEKKDSEGNRILETGRGRKKLKGGMQSPQEDALPQFSSAKPQGLQRVLALPGAFGLPKPMAAPAAPAPEPSKRKLEDLPARPEPAKKAKGGAKPLDKKPATQLRKMIQEWAAERGSKVRGITVASKEALIAFIKNNNIAE